MLEALFATVYGPFMVGVERAGLARWRADLLRECVGDTLEIGAGTGLNLPYFPEGLRLTLLEPSDPMRAKLAVRAPGFVIVDSGAEQLPFEDASFDTVVSGLVLCTVRDLSQSLSEVMRVLRPGGRLLFIEHVADKGWVGGLQRVLEPVWKVAVCGCHLTRDTESALSEAGFELTQIDRSPLPGGFLVVKAAIHGIATKPG